MTTFAVVTTRLDGTTVVAVRGELDVATAPGLDKALVDAAGHGTRLVIDLRSTSFLDSTGMKLLVRAARRSGDGFAVVCPPDNTPVMRVVGLAGFSDVVPFHSTMAELGLDDA